MKLFYKEIVRFILKFVIVSYFKFYFGWVKKFKKRKIIYFYLIRKVISVLYCYYYFIFLEISEYDYYGRLLFLYYVLKVVYSVCYWFLSGDVGIVFVVILKMK